MSRWIVLVFVLLACTAAAQSSGYYETIRYRVNDPFVFCTQGQDPKRFPDRCWIPLPPYTGNYMMMPYCDPPNSYGKSWTNADWDSLYQYERVCPQAQTSGGWEGGGQPEQTPFTH